MIDRFAGDYRFLSNFYPSPITVFGVRVDTVEHAYQAAKAESAHDRVAVLRVSTAGQAKRLGQKIEMREDWEAVKEMVMHTLLRRKFAIDELQTLLLKTDKEGLVEGNTWGDRYWGAEKTFLPADCDPSTAFKLSNPGHLPWWCPPRAPGTPIEWVWLGKNRLGVLLMRVRDELRLLHGL